MWVTVTSLFITHWYNFDSTIILIIVNKWLYGCSFQVVINLWSVHHDPERWSEPEIFKPTRFLDEDNRLVKKDDIIPFSLGEYMLGLFSNEIYDLD